MKIEHPSRSTTFHLSYLCSAVLLYIHNHWKTGLRIGFVLGVWAFAAGFGFLAGQCNPLYALAAACLPMLLVAVEEVVYDPNT